MMALLRLAGVIGAGVALLGALFLTLYGSVLLVNRADQPPSAAALELEGSLVGRPEVADEDNGFVYLLGFGAPREGDPRGMGAERAESLRRLDEGHGPTPAASNVPDGAWTLRELLEMPPPQVRHIHSPGACTARVAGAACHEALAAGEPWMRDWVAAHGWILERYRTLIAHSAWREISTYDNRMPGQQLRTAIAGQYWLFIESWRRAAEGDADAVRGLLEDDLAFWRMALAESDSFLARAAIVDHLTLHFQWGNVVLKRLPWELAAEAIPPSWRRPFDRAEGSMLRAFAIDQGRALEQLERYFSPSGTETLLEPAGPSRTERVLRALLERTLQRQDFANKRATTLLRLAETLDVSPEDYVDAFALAQGLAFPSWGQGFRGVTYNLAGNLMLDTERGIAAALAGEGARVADLEGLRRMALFAAEMRAAGVDDVPLALELSLPDMRNPYTGEPFVWDEARGVLWFRGLHRSMSGQHGIWY